MNDLGKKPIHTTILFTKYRATDTTQILSIFFLLKCGIFFGDVNVVRDLCINKFRFALILLVILLLVALLLKSDRSMPTVRKLAEIDEFMALKTISTDSRFKYGGGFYGAYKIAWSYGHFLGMICLFLGRYCIYPQQVFQLYSLQ